MTAPQTNQPDAPQSKSGWKTSEFWLSILSLLATTVQSIAPQKSGAAIISTGVLAATYTIGRSYVKSQTP